MYTPSDIIARINESLKVGLDWVFSRQGIGAIRITTTIADIREHRENHDRIRHLYLGEIGRGLLEFVGYGPHLALIDLVHLTLSGGSPQWWQELLRPAPIHVTVNPNVTVNPVVMNDQPPAYPTDGQGAQN